MKKKKDGEYLAPETKVIEINMRQTLLAGSTEQLEESPFGW